jgi:ribonuclease HII
VEFGSRCTADLERDLRARGYQVIAGADEAGRGALFGPVFAAAVVLSPERPIRGLNDSKQLDPGRREALAARIYERAVAWCVAAVDAATIDRINIYQASRLALKRAVEGLLPRPDFVLVDAVPLDLRVPQKALIHGDALSTVIAAASILAKTSRDACMRRWNEVYPQYHLAEHKGYATPEHARALAECGPTPLHRLSFEPVRNCSRFPVEPCGQLGLFAETAEAAACR